VTPEPWFGLLVQAAGEKRAEMWQVQRKYWADLSEMKVRHTAALGALQGIAYWDRWRDNEIERIDLEYRHMAKLLEIAQRAPGESFVSWVLGRGSEDHGQQEADVGAMRSAEILASDEG